MLGALICNCGHSLASHWPGPGRCLVCDCTTPGIGEMTMDTTPPLSCEPGSDEYQRLNEIVPDPDAAPSMRGLLTAFEILARKYAAAAADRGRSRPWSGAQREAEGRIDAAVVEATQLLENYVGAVYSPGAVAHGQPWPIIADLVKWLDRENGTSPHEQSMRLLKLAEEVGEVGQAYIGFTGQNPRKGVTHTAEQVAGELVDVIVTAMVALHGYVEDPAAFFGEKVDTIALRAAGKIMDASSSPRPPADGAVEASPAVRGAYGRHEYNGADRLHGLCRCGEGRDAEVHL